MIEFERLEPEDVLEFNVSLCADTGEHSACLDLAGLEAALERPWTGFGEDEFYPTIYDKAAALLHGIASRQVFENGNKRTAWAAAAAFLDINGVDLGPIQTVHADMFVRAAGLDHSLEIADLAEWFQITHEGRRPGYTQDARLEYLLLASAVEQQDGSTLTVRDGHLFGVICRELPAPQEVVLVTRIHWRKHHQGEHLLSVEVEDGPDGRVARPLRDWSLALDGPFVGGHEHQPDWIIPVISWLHMPISLIRPGHTTLVVKIDGQEVGRVPFMVGLDPEAPEDLAGLLDGFRTN